jgi:predicted RNase H-like nuclease (RuvC/YqgF family)
MEQKNSKMLDNKIMQAVSAYCKLNDIEDIDGFIKKCFDTGFNIEKYGLLGKTLNGDEKDLKTGETGEKHLIKEVIVEKRVEIPVEVIKEVEKIIEVPVEVIKEIEKIVEVPVDVIKEVVVEKEIIKEVPVEKVVTKIEYISDKTSENELIGKIEQLEENIFHLNKELEDKKQIFSTKTTEMENNFHYEMSNKDKELDELRRNLDVKLDDNKVKMLQQTIQNLNSEIRELKKKNEELEKKLLDTPKQLGNIPAKFHGSSNLNDDLYK